MASSFNPDPSRSAAPRSTERDTRSDAAGDEGPLLDAVLEQTLARLQSPQSLDATELAALEGTAARFRGEPLKAERAGVELVKALLGPSFRRATASTAQWDAMTLVIAHVLVDDPVAGPCLDELWQRLSGGRS